jgi:hypothetical protein
MPCWRASPSRSRVSSRPVDLAGRASRDLREEPDAGKPHVRIREGEAEWLIYSTVGGGRGPGAVGANAAHTGETGCPGVTRQSREDCCGTVARPDLRGEAGWLGYPAPRLRQERARRWMLKNR